VGAPRESSSATGVNGDQANNQTEDSGAVYVFRGTGTTWAQEAYLKASNTDGGDAFGASLSLAGEFLAVVAAGDDSNAIGVGGDQTNEMAVDSGAVHVFNRTGTTWARAGYLKASNTHAGDAFGTGVSLSQDTLAVGAPGESSNAVGLNGDDADTSAPVSGAFFIFQ
jgi:hypothetical protein